MQLRKRKREICKKSARFGLKVLREPKRFKDLQDQILQISYRLPAGKIKIGHPGK